MRNRYEVYRAVGAGWFSASLLAALETLRFGPLSDEDRDLALSYWVR